MADGPRRSVTPAMGEAAGGLAGDPAGEWSPGPSTRLAGVIGHPIRHSRSPAILNAAFRATGLDWAYLAFDVPEGGAAGALAAMRSLDVGGLSVTMPHKQAVAAAVDVCTDAARALDAVNCVVPDGQRLVGHNTDGDGFLRSLAADAAFDPAGRRCLVWGAGGAARAIVAALDRVGAAEVVVVNRTADRAEVAVALAGAAGRLGTPADVADADLVVNATSIGMGAEPATGPTAGPVPPGAEAVHDGQVVVDIVYQPVRTPLLARAEAVGATPVDGVGMLVHQAAVAFELWTGHPAPVAVMAAAARAGLAD